MEIVGAALPAPAMEYVRVNYMEDEVNQASKITDASDIVTYKAQVKGMDLIFDSNGNFIKSVEE